MAKPIKEARRSGPISRALNSQGLGEEDSRDPINMFVRGIIFSSFRGERVLSQSRSSV